MADAERMTRKRARLRDRAARLRTCGQVWAPEYEGRRLVDEKGKDARTEIRCGDRLCSRCAGDASRKSRAALVSRLNSDRGFLESADSWVLVTLTQRDRVGESLEDATDRLRAAINRLTQSKFGSSYFWRREIGGALFAIEATLSTDKTRADLADSLEESAQEARREAGARVSQEARRAYAKARAYQRRAEELDQVALLGPYVVNRAALAAAIKGQRRWDRVFEGCISEQRKKELLSDAEKWGRQARALRRRSGESWHVHAHVLAEVATDSARWDWRTAQHRGWIDGHGLAVAWAQARGLDPVTLPCGAIGWPGGIRPAVWVGWPGRTRAGGTLSEPIDVLKEVVKYLGKPASVRGWPGDRVDEWVSWSIRRRLRWTWGGWYGPRTEAEKIAAREKREARKDYAPPLPDIPSAPDPDERDRAREKRRSDIRLALDRRLWRAYAPSDYVADPKKRDQWMDVCAFDPVWGEYVQAASVEWVHGEEIATELAQEWATKAATWRPRRERAKRWN